MTIENVLVNEGKTCGGVKLVNEGKNMWWGKTG
jgi:hypothetical protein